MSNSGIKIKYGIICAGLIGFAILWIMMYQGRFTAFDGDVSRFFYDLRSNGLTGIMILITYISNWEEVSIICLLLLMYPQTRIRYGIPVISAVALAQIFKTIVKETARRARPDESLHLIVQKGYSFPSGHAITGMALFGVLFILVLRYFEKGMKKNILLAGAVIIPPAIGISRIYLGVHYPSDVLAGWIGGIVVVCVIAIFMEKIEWDKRWNTYE